VQVGIIKQLRTVFDTVLLNTALILLQLHDILPVNWRLIIDSKQINVNLLSILVV